MLRNIGEMRHRITFQRPKHDGSSGKGYPNEIWEDVAKSWAYREDISGKEIYGDATVNLEETVMFTIRYREGIDNSMRILHRDEEFNITHVGGGRNVGDLLFIRTVRKGREIPGDEEDTDGGDEG